MSLPVWFKQKPANIGSIIAVYNLLADLKLNTVCQGARCPNLGQCFARGTATFMILGLNCTRRCTFCAVGKGQPCPPDADEPAHLVEAVARLKLSYVVITSVTRDDLPDGGAGHFALAIERLRTELPEVKTEVLIPDFRGNHSAIETVVNARPVVIAHNLETVPRLYPEVRPQADYRRSLDLLAQVKETEPAMITKSGLMLGMGESRSEVTETMQNLRKAGCDLLTLGQYLAPSQSHHPVISFISPADFAIYESIGLEMGFRGIASAPLVRSSFRADELYREATSGRQNGK